MRGSIGEHRTGREISQTRRAGPPLLAVLVLALLQLPVATAAQQPATISGRVVEFGTSAGVVGVSLLLPGVGRALSGSNGEFRIARVPAGAFTLAVTRVGYQSQEIQLDIARDTTLLIQLELAPVRLDSVVVQARTVTIRGHVDERATRDPITNAEVIVAGDRMAYTNIGGSFKVTRVPAGVPVSVLARAVGFLPSEIEVLLQRDSAVNFQLEPDPIGQRMMQMQVQRLDRRAGGTAYRIDRWDRRDLALRPGATVYTLLAERLGPRMTGIECVFIDEVERGMGAAELKSYFTDEMLRLEVLNRGTMVRVYTRNYMGKLMAGATLQPIVLIKGLGPTICK